MRVEAGRRYRFTNLGGASETVVAQKDHDGDVFIPISILPGSSKLFLEIKGKATDIGGCGKIETMPDDPGAPARPLLGEGSIDLDELRRTFADWDFSTGTY